MRKTKMLSMLLALLMVVSCIPATLFAGVSAAEATEGTEAPSVSYKDPRESATKIYYAPITTVTSAMLAEDEYFASATKLSGNSAIYSALTNGYAGAHAASGGWYQPTAHQ